jgi:hypothetical protein
MRNLRFTTTGESNMSDTINWPEYNKTLIERGKLSFWLSNDLKQVWYSEEEGETYSDRAIEILSILRFKFGLNLREIEGFSRSLFSWMGLDLKIPSYSTLCRRLGTLKLTLWQDISPDDRIHVVVDSTGLKVYGEGEWKVRIHGYSKRRTWRKVHLAIDEKNNRILGVVLTTNDFKDNEVFHQLINQIDLKNIRQVTGDGAYDDKKCFGWAEENKVKAVFPPRRDAKIQQHGNSKKKPKIRLIISRPHISL